MSDAKLTLTNAEEWALASYRKGAEDMRERAAKYCDDRAERMGGVSDMARLLESAGKGIRALDTGET